MNLTANTSGVDAQQAYNEAKTVAAAQRGSRDAFNALMKTYEAQLKGFLARRVNANAVEDVLQDTWLAAWQAMPKFSRRGRFRAWLYGIAFHKSIDYHRSKSRTPVEIPLEETLPAPDMHDWSGAAELKEDVLRLINELPAEQLEVLDLYYYGELTLAEVALELKRNLNTVKSQFYRAHATIALQFEQSGKDRQGVVLLAGRRSV